MMKRRGDAAGFALIEAVVAVVLVAVMLALAVPSYLGFVADRTLQTAAHLIQADLRFAQQTAIARAGSGPRVEFCLHAGGYQVYPVNYDDAVARTGATAGAVIKRAAVGHELQGGIVITITPTPPDACAAPFSGQAILFSGAGTPVAAGAQAPVQTITLTYRGRQYRVVVAPSTGRITVTR
ncbi:MAG: GspH/FimT family pseudopilin [Armatimonadota bacterium]|nr:GspH/FimT family pseudopilin [Armatimonadota bacterium]MDR7421105.1 GspH/FimT family pseudopilin [Armatimonadota bacterium]MDR7453238.1 GspH/FimT family pseudopilin [Armatimonadota bacterium]MDR7455854.1 GspH/FimT family pseudopilin [Armatimonadota bacterium]MDR7497095.1 GspH/FimT family pseudopilin [Armatimonadota bacterium]